MGPGIFIVGYIIGTGSVTTMASSGAKYGLSLTWALALSCLFTYFMIVAISRITIVTGQTLMYSIRNQFGGGFAIFLILSLMLTVLLSIMGVMGIATDIFQAGNMRGHHGPAIPIELKHRFPSLVTSRATGTKSDREIIRLQTHQSLMGIFQNSLLLRCLGREVFETDVGHIELFA